MPPRPISRATRYLPTRRVPTGIFDSLEDIENGPKNATPFRSQTKRLILVGVDTGGTDEKRERLVAIGEIAAEVAHELRNALQIISANVYLAKQDLSKSEGNLLK